jgi:hypothetical protein
MSLSFLLKRSSTANVRPLAAGLSAGELALNNNDSSLGLFYRDSSSSLRKVGPAQVAAVAPADACRGETWLDTTINTLGVYNGTGWATTTNPFAQDFFSSLPTAGRPLHVYGVKWLVGPQISDTATPYTIGVKQQVDSSNINPIPASSVNAIQNSWLMNYQEPGSWTDAFRLYDQVASRTLVSTGGAQIYLNSSSVPVGQVGGLIGFKPTNDAVSRAFYDAPNLVSATETGAAFWCIVQFTSSDPSSPVGSPPLFEGAASSGSFGTGSFSLLRVGTTQNIKFDRSYGNVFTNLALNGGVTAPNTIMVHDTGTAASYSLNGGALQTGTSFTGVYTVGSQGLGVGGPGGVRQANREWGNGIVTACYWIGSAANCPTAAQIKAIADTLHASL